MTIELVLARHAKSDWGDPGLRDHDRPLNERGLRDAPRMAARLAETGFRPDALLSSTAVRARTTAEAFAAALETAVTLVPDLYGAPPATLLATASTSGALRVMLVAHNPGMAELADALSGGRIGEMPTCAVARFRWDDDDWAVVGAVDPDEWHIDTPR
ncbi:MULTISPECIES: histidine phosphatase family protein [unclassified Microbacterium]|uniref:SixA phosphatase family protein n=1 Tax=unclassified Microbacterium TaxID=2609290 RepID=UPI000F54E9C8|nr:histidine phosphatase family protein [Microbacterium sp. ABRD28]AZC14421.1 phosphohistidine phosphatase [Microbacterium sp. ABRD28]